MAGLAAVLTAAVAGAQVAGPVPEPLRDVGVEERLSEPVPLDLEFRDETGEVVTLRQYFDRGRPVLLTLNYYKCPMLCGLQLNGLAEGLEQLSFTPGAEFEIVTVSINPLETPALAAEKKQNYIRKMGRPAAAAGWHFLTGHEPQIEALADAVGFRYAYDPETGEYAHAAAVVVATPDGTIARYLYGIEYPQKNLRLALLEAADGTIGSPFDQLVLYCFHYDPSSRRYAPVAMNIMRVGGAATVVVLGLTLGLLWARETTRRGRKEKRDANA
jgi:protein SCO1/2